MVGNYLSLVVICSPVLGEAIMQVGELIVGKISFSKYYLRSLMFLYLHQDVKDL